MAVKLYRRHRADCEGNHPEDSRSGEFEEGRRGWKKCSCAIHASGTIAGKFNRKNTRATRWDESKLVLAQWERSGSWDGDVKVTLPPAEQARLEGVTIERATTLFLSEIQETSAFATHKKYRLLMKNFKAFSKQRGYVLISQWEPLDVREFRSIWAVSPQTAVRRMSMLKPFFEYCVANEWISRNPARLVKNPRGRDATEKRGEQKLPFSDEEIQRMYGACETYRNAARHTWTGEDVADFISVSIYTGMRISDVALFHVDRMKDNGEIHIRTTKAGTHVYTWVPEWLQDRIRARAEVHGPHIFGKHTSATLDVIGEVWRRKLNRVWELCGPWKDKPTPHRFRHTFARILLQKPGVTVRDVAELLGNTEDMVRRHYGAWVPERQERLTKVLREAFQDKPKPKVVSIK